MHHTTLVKALSITLLLSCASTYSMNKSSKKAAVAKGKQQIAEVLEPKDQKETVQHAGPAGLLNANQNTPIAEDSPSSSITESISEEAVVAETKSAVVEKATVSETPKQALQTLLGKELAALYNTDEKPLVQQGRLFATDATVPYKDEGRLVIGLEKNDGTYLANIQAQQDLNRTLNHICAGIIQKIKEQSVLDQESKTRTFTIDQIEAILETQVPRAMVLSNILSLCQARIKAKQEPVIHPIENAVELAQKCLTGLSQLQLERKRIRSQQENDRIRQIKDAQRLSFEMRLTKDKGTISDDEYSDAFIFDKTTGNSI